MHINATYIESSPNVVAGRIGIVMGLLAFAAVYVVMMLQLGWIGGIAIGWLPAALAGWLAATGCDFVMAHLLREPMPIQQSAPPSNG
ncbi:hypothetical protein [Noviherbaspirillum denitrificans]|uniref:Uncharacterized protein n=1 Tax=Noviherbaspirillum denitrificans TaxID=1968433 RepID=A0A254TIL8_9BURK|nr:hypothetical protein [Noviherbaspirillum denitrificans]OWW20403.1 hypothetical protein AYR66_13825 [Noviherbaspirillum denitrificans]